MWKNVQRVFGIDAPVNPQDMTLEEFTDMAAGELFSGQRLTEYAPVSNLENVRLRSVSDLAKANGSHITEEKRIDLDGQLNRLTFKLREP